MFAAKELGLDLDMLSWRLRQLTLVLPDLGAPGWRPPLSPCMQAPMPLRRAGASTSSGADAETQPLHVCVQARWLPVDVPLCLEMWG